MLEFLETQFQMALGISVGLIDLQFRVETDQKHWTISVMTQRYHQYFSYLLIIREDLNMVRKIINSRQFVISILALS